MSFVLTEIDCILDMDFPYLYLILLPLPPSMDLWYGLFVIMIFCITLILVKKLI